MQQEPLFLPAEKAKLEAAVIAYGFTDLQEAIDYGDSADFIDELDDPGMLLAALLAALDRCHKLHAGILAIYSTATNKLMGN